jgi:hypothetical protein
MGALAGPAPGDGISQFNEVDFRGALAFTVTACLVSADNHAIAAMIEGKREIPAAHVGRAPDLPKYSMQDRGANAADNDNY